MSDHPTTSTTELDPGNPFQSFFGLALGSIGSILWGDLTWHLLAEGPWLDIDLVVDCAGLIGQIGLLYILVCGAQWLVAGRHARSLKRYRMYPAIYPAPAPKRRRA